MNTRSNMMNKLIGNMIGVKLNKPVTMPTFCNIVAYDPETGKPAFSLMPGNVVTIVDVDLVSGKLIVSCQGHEGLVNPDIFPGTKAF